jgi:hypothetical protein
MVSDGACRGGEDKQAASHYGGGQAEVDPISGDSRASSAWGSGTNSPKQETAKQFEGSCTLLLTCLISFVELRAHLPYSLLSTLSADLNTGSSLSFSRDLSGLY